MSDIDLDAIRQRVERIESLAELDATGLHGQAYVAAVALAADLSAADVPDLLAEVELLQAEVDRERGKVGDLVRKLNDITRGQLSSWPPTAFTAGPPLPEQYRTAGPSLPQRIPMQAAFEVGEFPAIVQPAPMTDPALEDRTEGSEP